jgi:hypothetical protein
MRDVGLNLCDFFPKLFEFFRDRGLVLPDGVLNLATTLHVLRGLQIPHSALLLRALVSFWCPPHFRSPPLVAPIMGSHVSGCQAANRLIETVIAPNFCRFQSPGLLPAMKTGVPPRTLLRGVVFGVQTRL